MRNFARNSKFDINVDFEKSLGSYIHDKNSDKKYLDFFGMYASLPLGYNHPIFLTDSFKQEILRVSSFKVTNCEFVSDETLEFDKMFSIFAGQGKYDFFHYCCTGSLAVEAAIKVCMLHKKHQNPKIISFHNSFHGINGFGSFVTSRFFPAHRKLNFMPEPYSEKIDMNLKQVEDLLKRKDITCILVEPIQCSSGDIHHDRDFFLKLEKLALYYDVPVIYDEVQIGFGTTGKLWYFNQIQTSPDIVVFGKKTQLSGIMAKYKFKDIFHKNNCTKLEVTWDGDVTDMIRCKYIMRAYEKYNILENVSKQSKILVTALDKIEYLKNVRNCGLIVGFDLTSQEERDMIVKNAYKNGLICNSTGLKSVRLRPSLNISDDDTQAAIKIITKSCEEQQC